MIYKIAVVSHCDEERSLDYDNDFIQKWERQRSNSNKKFKNERIPFRNTFFRRNFFIALNKIFEHKNPLSDLFLNKRGKAARRWIRKSKLKKSHYARELSIHI